MSREIKFRAWDKETNKYFEPTYQSYMGRIEELTIALSGRLQKRTYRGVADESTFHGRYVVEQYTGLKDANDKEIYEGDFLKVKTEDNWQAIPLLVKNVWDPHVWINESDPYYAVGEMIVIGNIHKAPTYWR